MHFFFLQQERKTASFFQSAYPQKLNMLTRWKFTHAQSLISFTSPHSKEEFNTYLSKKQNTMARDLKASNKRLREDDWLEKEGKKTTLKTKQKRKQHKVDFFPFL